MESVIEYLSTVRSDRAGGIGDARVRPEHLESVCVRMAYERPPRRGGFVLPGVQAR